MRVRWALILGTFLFSLSGELQAACEAESPALPQSGARDDILVVVNDNSQTSCELAKYYAQQRDLGQNNIVHVRAPSSYFITWTDYEILREPTGSNLSW